MANTPNIFETISATLNSASETNDINAIFNTVSEIYRGLFYGSVLIRDKHEDGSAMHNASAWLNDILDKMKEMDMEKWREIKETQSEENSKGYNSYIETKEIPADNTQYDFMEFSEEELEYILEPFYHIYEEDTAASIIETFMTGDNDDDIPYRDLCMNEDEFSCILEGLCPNDYGTSFLDGITDDEVEEWNTEIYVRLKEVNDKHAND